MFGVIFGGPTPEHDISILTGLQAVQQLSRGGNEVAALYWTKTGAWYLVPASIEAEAFLDGVPKGSSVVELRTGDAGGFVELSGRFGKDKHLDIDAVIVATHGGPGEDGSLQAALDLAQIPYSGPSVAGAALGMDKWAFGAVVAALGLPTLPRVLLTSATSSVPFDGPYIVKPRFGGSSIGIDVVADLNTAHARLTSNPHLSRGAVLEPYRADLTDVQIAVRTFPSVHVSAIEKPIRRSSNAEILDYRDKYVGGSGMVAAPRELPAQLPAGQAQTVIACAHALVEGASVRGVARIDFLANDNELYVNEINTIPGSLSKHLFVEPVLAFSELLGDLLREAVQRPTARYSAAGADGLVLRSAGSIAAKLA